jgi:hypothetical protein
METLATNMLSMEPAGPTLPPTGRLDSIPSKSSPATVAHVLRSRYWWPLRAHTDRLYLVRLHRSNSICTYFRSRLASQFLELPGFCMADYSRRCFAFSRIHLHSLPSQHTPPPKNCHQFLVTLDHWDQELFPELIMNVKCYRFVHLVNSQVLLSDTTIQLITVSDSSDNSSSMTFGWVIALWNGHQLAQCASPVYGPCGSSFWAKGCGFLSVSHFLLRFFKYCAVTPKWEIKMMTNNQGLLTRIETSLPHLDPFPNLTLALDWDFSHKISQSFWTFQRPPTLIHIKGHQDNHSMEYSALPPPGSSTEYRRWYSSGLLSMHTPISTTSYSLAPIQSSPITCWGQSYLLTTKTADCEAATVPDYLRYIVTCNKWTYVVVTMIDWQMYTQANGRFRT